MDSSSEPFLAEVRETFGRLVYTQKTHEQLALVKTRRAIWLKIVNLVLVVATLAATVVAALAPSDIATWTAVGVALVATVFLAIQLSLDPQGDAALQRLSARLMLAQSDDYTRLIADAKSGVDLAELRARRDALAARGALLFTLAPRTSANALEKARRGLVAVEELTLQTEEVNRMLPLALREPVPVKAAPAPAAEPVEVVSPDSPESPASPASPASADEAEAETQETK